jgi:hypothetical protein
MRIVGLLILLLSPLPALLAQRPSASGLPSADTLRHGTCALFLQNRGNAAFVIDSAITEEDQAGQVIGTQKACKVWLQTPTVLAATTGLLSAGNLWNAQDAAKSVLGSLPSAFTPTEVARAVAMWSHELLTLMGSYTPRENGEIASLLVMFRYAGDNYFFRERVVSDNHVPRRDYVQSGGWPLTDTDHELDYAGNCRNFISIAGNPPPIELSIADRAALDKLGTAAKSKDTHSASQLGQIGLSMVEMLAQFNQKYDKEHSDDAIGPPYQVLFLNAGTDTWASQFSGPCATTASRRPPSPRRSSRSQ